MSEAELISPQTLQAVRKSLYHALLGPNTLYHEPEELRDCSLEATEAEGSGVELGGRDLRGADLTFFETCCISLCGFKGNLSYEHQG